MRKTAYSPHPLWRNQFEFKPQYSSTKPEFVLDPLLTKFSTNAPFYNVWAPVHTQK